MKLWITLIGLTILRVTYGEESQSTTIPADSEQMLIANVIRKSSECVKETGVKIDDCIDLLKPSVDHTDVKYKPCKCLIPCVSKKLGVLDENGHYMLSGIQSLIGDLKTKSWKREAVEALDSCKEGNYKKGCEGGYELLECLINNSKKGKRTINSLINLFVSNDD